MFVNIGNAEMVNEKDIIGFFDFDSTTVSKRTRQYLERAEKKGDVKNVAFDIPKTFIITAKGKDKQTVFFSQLSTATLTKRAEENIGIAEL